MATRSWDGDAGDRVHVSRPGSVGAYSYEEHDHHGFWELTYVRRGRLRQIVDGVTIEQGPGWMTLVREGQRHALAGTQLEFLNLSFPSAFVRAFAHLPHAPGEALATTLHGRGLLAACLPLAERAGFEAELEALGAGHGSAEEALRLAGLFARALLACHHQRTRPGEGPPWLARMQAAMGFADEPLPDLAGLRRQAGVSAAHFARTCRRHLGLSPSQWLNRLRVERGARMLVAGRPVDEVARAVGFREASYFSRCFHRHFGSSPRTWRTRQEAFAAGESRWALRRSPASAAPGGRSAPG